MSARFNPYSVKEESDGSYSFTTDTHILYKVVFINDDLFSEYTHLHHLIFEFSVEVAHLGEYHSPPKDYRTAYTIVRIIQRFFEANSNGLLFYICDSLDNKGYQRYCQFEHWYQTYKSKAVYLDKINYQAQILDKIHYASLLISANNPHRQELTAAFSSAVGDYNSKID